MAKKAELTHNFIPRQACFRFYVELNDYLPIHCRYQQNTYRFIDTPSVKDAIEAQQVPHTDVDLILIDGHSSLFDQCIQFQGCSLSSGLVSLYELVLPIVCLSWASMDSLQPLLNELSYLPDIAIWLSHLALFLYYPRKCVSD
ncbi:ubiquitin family protein [Endozoicomonas numazuensis]|uniref:hypothetical protein n=1 Tax=Endozoicomonas numazuensis TaxID=1137799 RepID=UPI0009DECA89